MQDNPYGPPPEHEPPPERESHSLWRKWKNSTVTMLPFWLLLVVLAILAAGGVILLILMMLVDFMSF